MAASQCLRDSVHPGIRVRKGFLPQRVPPSQHPAEFALRQSRRVSNPSPQFSRDGLIPNRDPCAGLEAANARGSASCEVGPVLPMCGEPMRHSASHACLRGAQLHELPLGPMARSPCPHEAQEHCQSQKCAFGSPGVAQRLLREWSAVQALCIIMRNSGIAPLFCSWAGGVSERLIQHLRTPACASGLGPPAASALWSHPHNQRRSVLEAAGAAVPPPRRNSTQDDLRQLLPCCSRTGRITT